MMAFTFGPNGYSQIPPLDPDPLPDSLKQFKLCDATFKDMMPLMKFPGNVDLTNMVAFASLDQNDYNKEYFWDLGDGTKDTGKVITHKYATSGKYLVSLHVVQHIIGIYKSFEIECSSSQWVNAGNNIPPFCDASFRPLVYTTMDYPSLGTSEVAGYTASNQNYKSYHWDFGDGTQDTGRSVRHHFVNEGKYLVSLTVKDDYCEGTQTMWMTKKGVYYPFDSSITRCDAQIIKNINHMTVAFSDHQPVITVLDGNYETWNWDFGDGSANNENSMTHTYAKARKYLATLTKSSYYNPCFGNSACFAAPVLKCTKTYQFEVVIGEPESKCKAELSFTITDKTLKIRDNILYLSMIESPNKITERRHWDFGDGRDTVSNNFVTHTYTSAGKYKVRLIKSILDDPCPFIHDTLFRCMAAARLICTDTTYLDIEVVNEYPTCKAKLDHTISGSTVEISDLLVYISKNASIIDPITEYRSWDFGDGSDAGLNDRNPNVKVSHTYANAGKYRIRLLKSLVNDPCPFIHDTLPRCKAMAIPICIDTTYLDVEIIKPCKAIFETSIVDSTVSVLVNPLRYAIFDINNSLKFKSDLVYKIDPLEMIPYYYSRYSKIDFGDGSFEEITGYNYTTTHTYAKKGDYNICLYIATVPDSVLPYVKLAYYCNDTFCQTITISDSNPIVASIYPNPASDYMTVSVKNSFNKIDLRLYDQTGKLKKEVFEIQADPKEIDTNGLENGLYFYTLSNGDNVVLKGKIAVSK